MQLTPLPSNASLPELQRLATTFKSFRQKLAVASTSPLPTKKQFKSYAETCASLLLQCADPDPSLAPLGLALHAHALRSGLSSHRSVLARLLSMYSRWGRSADRHRLLSEPSAVLFARNLALASHAETGRLDAARELFDEMPERTAGSWTVMIDALMKRAASTTPSSSSRRTPFGR
uniref:Pentatricopeptide repeat-containing protein n=1 Tax=Ananas comosus var. bracteatus TaxID=296719 RepID=A0A6V7NYQ3_ANACO|nr:unnamed protein product [Ananas comosus var. bracteatus]